MSNIERYVVIKMLDGTWNVRDDQTYEWVPDAIGITRKPWATKIADALNNQRGAVDRALPGIMAVIEDYGDGVEGVTLTVAEDKVREVLAAALWGQ